jgi:hypothetical protein
MRMRTTRMIVFPQSCLGADSRRSGSRHVPERIVYGCNRRLMTLMARLLAIHPETLKIRGFASYDLVLPFHNKPAHLKKHTLPTAWL